MESFFDSSVVETQINEENSSRTDKVTEVLVKNSGIYTGSYDDDRTSLVTQEVLDVFKPTVYPSVERMKEILVSGTDTQKKNSERSLKVLGKSFCLSLNFSFPNRTNPEALFLERPEESLGLVTEKIEENLPTQLKGVGELAIKAYSELTESEKETMKRVNFLLDKIRSEEDTDSGKLLIRELKSSPVGSAERRYCDMAVKSLGWVEHEGRRGSNFRPLRTFAGEGGDDDRETREQPSWMVSKEAAAKALKKMADDLRWSTWTPPEWFKEMTDLEQERFLTMVLINDGASWLKRWQNADLEKCRLNPAYTEFSKKRLTELFNEDFTLVMSKMLNDLTELHTNKDGVKMLRYKENDDNTDIRSEVKEKITKIDSYKEELAQFLADRREHKKGVVTPEDLMNASTAWNLFFMMGDSSFADRLRALSPPAGVLSDKFRTLNAEAKAGKKWRLLDKLQPNDEKELYKSEWFGGSIAKYISKIAHIEQTLDRAIDQKTGKTLKEKLASGEIEFFSNTTCIGLLDLIGGDQLENKDTRGRIGRHGSAELIDNPKNTTLAEMLLNYGRYDEKGKFVRTGLSFDFGEDEVDPKYMADFRDMQESASRCFNLATGKVPAGKDIDAWVSEARSAIGLANQIELNGKRVFGYTRRPEFWGMMILNSFGVDVSRLSTDYVYLKTSGKLYYNAEIIQLLRNNLALDDSEVPLKNLMKYLGCIAKRDLKSFLDNEDTQTRWVVDRKKTDKLDKELERKASSFVIKTGDEDYITEKEKKDNRLLSELNRNYIRARKVSDEVTQDRIKKEIELLRSKIEK